MKILITGGAGFIGSHLVDAYLDAGHEVIVVDSLTTGRRENVHQKAAFFKLDITNQIAFRKFLTEIKPDVINHHAAQVSVAKSLLNPEQEIRQVVSPILTMFDETKSYLKHFIYASTGGGFYSDGNIPHQETDLPQPISPYGFAKLLGEQTVMFLADLHQITATALRYSNVYGPRQNTSNESGVVAIFTNTCLAKSPLTIYGDGTQTRDYVYVDDVVAANLRVLQQKNSDIFHISTGRETTTKQLFELIAAQTQYQLPPNFVASREVEIQNSCLSFKKAQTMLSWEPSVDLEHGIKKTIEYYVNRMRQPNILGETNEKNTESIQ